MVFQFDEFDTQLNNVKCHCSGENCTCFENSSNDDFEDQEVPEKIDSEGEPLESTKKSFSKMVNKLHKGKPIQSRKSVIQVQNFNSSYHNSLTNLTNEFDNFNIDANGNPEKEIENSLPKKIGPSDFQVSSVIGAGAYGKVYMVRHKVTNEIYAMKVLKKASLVLHNKDAEHTKTERQILEEVRHPFIVDLHYAFQTPEKLFLLLSFACGGELFNYLQKEKMFDEDTARFYLSEIFVALDHLHSLGIIYRDLKPENVLLDIEGHILLTDFGLSKVALDAHTICGSLEYMAPEIVAEATYDKAVDYWSFGIMCHDLLTGKTPFRGNNRKKVMEAILKKKLNLPYYLSPTTKDLLNKLLKKNPHVRLGSKKGGEEVKNHLFFRNVNWTKVYNKETIPPIVPVVSGPDDICNFGTQFTTMSTDSIMIDCNNNNNSYSHPIGIESSSSKNDLFRGFSFVADNGFGACI